jgi:hypothetical protein
MNEVVFTITNELTGVRVDVYQQSDACFTVDYVDVDNHEYTPGPVFTSEGAAINHAILLS